MIQNVLFQCARSRDDDIDEYFCTNTCTQTDRLIVSNVYIIYVCVASVSTLSAAVYPAEDS